MLSLVAYDNSDESGSDSENEQSSVNKIPTKAGPVLNGETNTNLAAESGDSSDLGDKPTKSDEPTKSGSKANEGSLSLPSSQKTSINFDLKILDRKRSQPIRITIPSLKELEFDEGPGKKPKLRPSTKGSGLFSLLPEPKNVTSSLSKVLMPLSVAKKTQCKKPVPSKANGKNKKVSILDDDEEEEKGEPLTSFFFSSPDDVTSPPVDMQFGLPAIPSSVVSPISNHIPDVSKNVGLDTRVQSQNASFHSSSIIDPNSTDSPCHANAVEDTSLDSAAIMKLCGARERRKGPDLSDIIDVSGSSLVGDISLQMAKDLSKEQPTHSFKRKTECSSLQRRKHQITYLAEQAKAQELELRNNWAQNRMTRKQTQAKYGF